MSKKWHWMLAIMVLGSGLAVNPGYAQTEPPECSDGVDNDDDGTTDYPNDVDCVDANDGTEADIGRGFGTEITIRYARRTAFKGLVESQHRVCEEQRRVVLRRRMPEGTRTVARTFTDSQGRWEVYWPDARGRYFAVAPKLESWLPSGASIECRRDASVTIRAGLKKYS